MLSEISPTGTIRRNIILIMFLKLKNRWDEYFLPLPSVVMIITSINEYLML